MPETVYESDLIKITYTHNLILKHIKSKPQDKNKGGAMADLQIKLDQKGEGHVPYSY